MLKKLLCNSVFVVVSMLANTGLATVQPVDVASASELAFKDQLQVALGSRALHPRDIDKPYVDFTGGAYADQVVWVRFIVTGTDQPMAARYLQIDNPRVMNLVVWVQSANDAWRPIMRHGIAGEEGLSSNSRPGVWLPKSAEPITVLVRFSVRSSFSPDLRLFNSTRLNEYSRSVVFAETIGFGLLLALSLYACISFYVVRDRVYLCMGAYCLTCLLLVGHQAGYGLFLFGPGYSAVNSALVVSTPFFVFASFMALARRLMSLDSNWWFSAYVWGNCATGVILCAYWFEPLFNLALFVSGMLSILVTPFALFLALRGSRPARNFFVANLGSLAGGSFVLWSQLAGLSALDYSYAYLMYGNATTGLLVVLILALRFRALRAEQAHLREQEILSRQAAVESEAIAKAKSSFLATMSHEIRTPMNGVLGLTSLLADTQLEPLQLDYLRSIERSGRSLVSILDDILDYSKFEQGSVELETQEIDLVELVDDVMLGAQHRCKDKNLNLRTRFSPSAAEFVIGDATRLRQVLTNLVSNAVKFTEHGSVELSVWQEDEDTYFAIRDSGIGIAEDQIDSLFERFQQADRSITREYGGTGLGLAISRLLVRAMGGDIHVHSKVGVGSEFKASVRVPRSVRNHTAVVSSVSFVGSDDAVEAARLFASRWAQELQPDPHPDTLSLQCDWPLKLSAIRQLVCKLKLDDAVSSAVSKPLTGLNILVAEDNPVNRLVVEKHLQTLGAEVELVENGKLAVAKLDDTTVDLVLMDCEMPIMDGYTATREIRRALSVPIIALTAHAGEEHKKRALDAGMNGYLTKPIDRSELVRAVLDQVVGVASSS